MKFRLSDDPKVNPVGGRSVPLGFGRFADVEPGAEFDVLDPALAGNPTFVESGLFEAADDEARSAVEKARTAVEVTAEEVADESDPTAGGTDPVLAAALQAAGIEVPEGDAPTDSVPAAPAIADLPVTPAVVQVTDDDGNTREVVGELPASAAIDPVDGPPVDASPVSGSRRAR